MAERVFGAIDIGASSGRVMAGVVDPATGRTTLHTVHRFPNGAAFVDGDLRWDFTGLFAEVMTGLRALAQSHPQVESIGIDMWAVDYGLLDERGHLLAEPLSYRSSRTDAVVADVQARFSADRLYAVNGLQHLPFTTLYQLEAERRTGLWDKAAHVVLLPDLLAYRLTGELATERTNASTTGLLDISTGSWSPELLELVGLSPERLPPLQDPGTVRATLLSHVADATGLRRDVVVTTVGSHDTASAVVALPATSRDFAYVSSGTWSLVGLELDAPVVTTQSQQANFTNEAGVDGRTRFLRNVGGLWLLQESVREWSTQGLGLDQDQLLADAQQLPGGGALVDVDDPEFIAPGQMPDRIAAAASRAGSDPPASPAETVRCILDSLATAYARTVERAVQLSGTAVEIIHVVGGGSRNELLCQLTADLTGVSVTAGPVEETALGNVLVQARAHGAAPSTLEELRSQLRRSQEVRTFEPSPRGSLSRREELGWRR